MKLGIIIPDRNDRPILLDNCLRMIGEQTTQADIVVVVDNMPRDNEKDITWRYRLGYDYLRNKNLDAILFMENDDWYSPTYIETMLESWQKNNRPDIFGTDYTIYYHIKLRKWFTMHHKTRASAMNTLIKPDLNFEWCVDNEPYTDLWLWKILKGVTFKPKTHIALGMKHGDGLCGGNNHMNKLDRYINDDANSEFLKNTMDETSFDFYSKYQ